MINKSISFGQGLSTLKDRRICYNDTMSYAKSKLVYSTEQPVSKKERPAEKHPQAGISPADQKITVRLDRKGRGGKSVTVIEGLLVGEKERETLAKQLKARLGTGGTVIEGGIEIQGDHRDTVIAELEKRGYRP
ncbi:MAG: translation initiation factor, partial [Thermodesulfovibrionales bacterium]